MTEKLQKIVCLLQRFVTMFVCLSVCLVLTFFAFHDRGCRGDVGSALTAVQREGAPVVMVAVQNNKRFEGCTGSECDGYLSWLFSRIKE